MRDASPLDDLKIEELLPGTMLEGRYRILERLDEGGIGLVYRARHVKLKRLVAIKVLQQRFVEHESLRPRFEREARALATLSHPNIVAISDYGIFDDRPFLVMELLEGRPLRKELDEGVPSIDRTLFVIRHLLRGLSYAHSRGIVHRDVKPGNVFLREVDARGDQVKLLDFGFAQVLHRWKRPAGPLISSVDEAFGTPAYMAPEQLSGGSTGPRTDVYSVGVLMYEMLTGHKPFTGDLDEIVRKHLSEQVPALATMRPELSPTPELVALLERAMAKSPDLRFADADEMLSALDALPEPAARVATPEPEAEPLVEGRPPSSRWWWVPLAFLAFLTASTSVIFLLIWPPTHKPPAEVGQGTRIDIEDGMELDIEDGMELDIEDGTRLEVEDPSQLDIEDPTELDIEAGIVTEAGEEAAEGDLEAEAGAEAVDETGDQTEVGGEAEAEAEAEAQAEAEAEAEAAPPPAPPPPSDPALARLASLLDAGDPLTSAQVRVLRRRASADRENPIPHLLLARAYIARGWRTDAIERYELVFEISSEARHDPHMLADLITMSTHPNVGHRAAQVVVQIYGAEALPGVERALADPALRGPARHELEVLRNRLRP